MNELWLPLQDIPAEGRVFSFTDPSIWSGPWEEFGLPYTMGLPLSAELEILPQDKGCLVRGLISGSLFTPCDRCAEPAEISLRHEFEEYDALEDEPEAEMGEPLLRLCGGELELNAGLLLWEQFLMALPVKPLCAEQCKGLCPRCGQNLNTGACDCDKDGHDPRLAVLRTLKIS